MFNVSKWLDGKNYTKIDKSRLNNSFKKKKKKKKENLCLIFRTGISTLSCNYSAIEKGDNYKRRQAHIKGAITFHLFPTKLT